MVRPGTAGGSPGTLVEVMTPLVRVCAIAGVLLLLGGCASWTPNWDFLAGVSSGSNVSLTIESDPPGADAKRRSARAAARPA